MSFMITIKVGEEFDAMEKKRDLNKLIKENLTRQLVALASLDSSAALVPLGKTQHEFIVELVEDIVDSMTEAVINILVAEAALGSTESEVLN